MGNLVLKADDLWRLTSMMPESQHVNMTVTMVATLAHMAKQSEQKELKMVCDDFLDSMHVLKGTPTRDRK